MRILILGLFLLAGGCAEKNEKSAESPDGSVSAVNFSGQEVGNGGDAVVCKNSYSELGGKRVRLLDYYEAKTFQGWTLDFTGADSVDDRVALAISRLEKIDADRAALYRNYAESFWDEAQILENVHLPDLPDDGPVSLPGSDCELRQLAIQRKPFLPEDKRYIIDGKIWAQLDDDSKAGLILHEIAYRETKDLGHKTSTAVRYLNGMLAANALTSLTHDAYADLLEKTLSMPAVLTVSGIRLKMRGLQFGPGGEVERGDVAEDRQMTEFNKSPKTDRTLYVMKWNGFEYGLLNPSVQFSESGTIAFEVGNDTHTPSSHGSATCGSIYSFSGLVTFGRDGTLLSIEADENEELTIAPCLPGAPKLSDQPLGIKLTKTGTLHFMGGSIPVEAVESRVGGWVLNKGGHKADIYPGDILKFDENGRVDLGPSLFDPLVKRPDGLSNVSGGHDSGAHIRIEAKADATKLFDALENFSKQSDSDGELRFFASIRLGISMACKRWSDGDVACDANIKDASEGFYYEDGDRWTMRIRNYKSGSQRDVMIRDFLGKLSGAELGKCGNYEGKSLVIGRLSICAGIDGMENAGETEVVMEVGIER